jgi:Zn-dependent protease
MNAQETRLVESIGMQPGRVLTRRPLTIALGRRWYLSGVFCSLLAFAITVRHGLFEAFVTAAVAGLAFTVALAAHECGHLLFARRVRGVTPRILLMRSTGGVSIVEGRYEDARGAALFAAGGPIASLVVSVAYTVAGLLLPAPFSTALVLPAVLNLCLLGMNLLPLAPMDGYMLFRSWLWANLGNREEAERRALVWSLSLLVYGLALSLLLLQEDTITGLASLAVLATFGLQHRLAARRFRSPPRC